MAAPAVNRWRQNRNYSRCRWRVTAVYRAALTTTRIPSRRTTVTEVFGGINSPCVITSTIWSRKRALPLGRKIDNDIPSVPGNRSMAVANSRGIPANDGPGGLEVMSADRREILGLGRHLAKKALTIAAAVKARK